MKLLTNIALALALGALTAGCGNDNDCRSLCEEAKGCANASDADKNANCDQQCSALEEKCSEQVDDLSSCIGDACDETSCPEERAAVAACVLGGG